MRRIALFFLLFSGFAFANTERVPVEKGDVVLISPVVASAGEFQCEATFTLLDEDGYYDVAIGNFLQEKHEIPLLGIYKWQVPHDGLLFITSGDEFIFRVKSLCSCEEEIE